MAAAVRGVNSATYANGTVLRPCDQELAIGADGDTACMIGLAGFLFVAEREAARWLHAGPVSSPVATHVTFWSRDRSYRMTALFVPTASCVPSEENWSAQTTLARASHQQASHWVPT